ncbi:MAG: UDP-N-acetylmuramoyl-L-alanyl-D-glutamate--2,6-diaminopimelate ligase [Desulfobulbaceae bacterium]|nr:UDP-N-acetylmuramoyl-L-alanyl-D-glutamate--2,6-diaminopimelate ligase [Desulfobulbaceae bacterium]
MNTEPSYSLGELLQAAGLGIPADTAESILQEPISAVVCDSRKAGPGSLFVAMPGHATAGHLFVQDAMNRGCRAVVVEQGQCNPDWPLACIAVQDAQQGLASLAEAWYGFPAKKMRLVGITGTNGKTTTSWLIEGMLVHAGFRPGVIGTVNYRYHGPDAIHVMQEASLTTPDALTLQMLLRRMVDAGVSHVIMELSSHALAQKRIGNMRFDVAVFTNLTRDHLDYHQNMEQYFSAKSLLFSHHLAEGATAVIATDVPGEEQPWGKQFANLAQNAKVLRTGLGKQCQVRARSLEYGLDGFSCELDACGQGIHLHSPLVGAYNVRNVLSAVGSGLGLGLRLEEICTGLAKVHAVPGRLERVLSPGADASLSPTVFVDYAHTPDALDNVLSTLRAVGSGRLICVFGCGGDRDRGKRPLMGEVAARHSDSIVVTSDNPRTEDPERILDDIIPGLVHAGAQCSDAEQLLLNSRQEPHYARICDRRRAIAMACSLSHPGDTILIAGKGHEDYQILGREKQFFDDRFEARNALAIWNERLLLAGTGGKKAGLVRTQTVLRSICTDSRTLAKGDVFLALKGEAFDGHTYIEQAMAAGAGAVIAERFPKSALNQEAVLCIQVEDSLAALGRLARFRRDFFAGPLCVAAITGSSGKTTVKEMVAAICGTALTDKWAQQQPVLKTSGNFNNLIGLPLSLLPLNAGHRVAVLEMGMNAPGEIAQLTRIADPDVGCISTVHPAHLQGLGSVAGVARAKGELFHNMRPDAIRVVNEDDPNIYRLACNTDGTQIGFAVTAAGRRRKPVVRITRLINLCEQGIRFTLHIGDWAKRLTVPTLGEHNAHNCAAAAAIAHAMGIGSDAIATGLSQYRPLDKRMVAKTLPGGVKLVNDAYNANPASMAAGLRTVAALAGNIGTAGARKGKCLAILGDMLELGEAGAVLHQDIGKLVAELGFSYLALTGSYAAETAQAARGQGMDADRVLLFSDPKAMGTWCANLIQQGALVQGDWILVKGSRGMRMEDCIEALDGQLQLAENSGANHAV